MTTLIYLHGFSSSGSTGTAVHLRNYLYQEYGVKVISPDIPVMPSEAMTFLNRLMEKERPDLIIGTSMGAMYAETQKGFRRICVNPAFQMSKLLTFRYLNKNVEFQNVRHDGAKSFKVDREMVSEFKEIELNHTLKHVTALEKELVWGIFGKDDPLVNYQKEFVKVYGKGHFRVIEGEHSLTQSMMKRDLLPLVQEILRLE